MASYDGEIGDIYQTYQIKQIKIQDAQLSLNYG